ncbi:hypothetical protein GCM10010300_86000 [Streptomyces olivaceoviridis]|uniref:AAA family ATPase n=1 Tax=Streptomyces olivaceoviridis TaxID=1921 RepID=UPI0019BA7426|nr:AAA family ATPase [Streptomyces olivaceoviridis]GGZ29982.1 hypothetical protein GCM10010300_86000 [Streptomyces olivaceoviridis]
MGRATFARVAALHRGPTDAGQRAPASPFVLSERLLPAGLGPAGAGKTTVMKLVAHAVDAASGRLIPLAPSCRAAKVFGDGLRLRAYILRSWLHQRTRLPACPTGSDGKFGPGYAVPDSDGHAASSHIGASGPPGMTVYGAYETFCADPTRKGPDAAGGYTGPKTAEHWTSSVAGRPVPGTHLAYASYIVGRYGQTRSVAQAAWVDVAVYEWLAGGTDGVRGRQRLACPQVGPSARTTVLGFLAEARKYAGPCRRARRARISIPQPPWRGPDRSHVRISELHAALFRVEQARPEAWFSGSPRDATHERQVTS